MGKSESKPLNKLDPTENAELLDESSTFKLYRNKAGHQFEKYRIESSNDPDFQNKYDYRIRNPSPYLVNAYYAKPIANALGCSSRNKFDVVTQRIYKRLSEIPYLSSEQALNTVYRSLKGYEQIFSSSGPLLVTQTMIGLDKDDKIKVWLNSNFGNNSKENQPLSYSVLPKNEQQFALVDNIVELINHKTQRSQCWVNYLEEKYSRGKIGFEEAIKIAQSQGERSNIHIEGSFKDLEETYVQAMSKPLKSEVEVINYNAFNKNGQIPNSEVRQPLYYPQHSRDKQIPKYYSPQPFIMNRGNSQHRIIENLHNSQSKSQINPNPLSNHHSVHAPAVKSVYFNQISGIRNKVTGGIPQQNIKIIQQQVRQDPQNQRSFSSGRYQTSTNSSLLNNKITFNNRITFNNSTVSKGNNNVVPQNRGNNEIINKPVLQYAPNQQYSKRVQQPSIVYPQNRVPMVTPQNEIKNGVNFPFQSTQPHQIQRSISRPMNENTLIANQNQITSVNQAQKNQINFNSQYPTPQSIQQQYQPVERNINVKSNNQPSDIKTDIKTEMKKQNIEKLQQMQGSGQQRNLQSQSESSDSKQLQADKKYETLYQDEEYQEKLLYLSDKSNKQPNLIEKREESINKSSLISHQELLSPKEKIMSEYSNFLIKTEENNQNIEQRLLQTSNINPQPEAQTREISTQLQAATKEQKEYSKTQKVASVIEEQSKTQKVASVIEEQSKTQKVASVIEEQSKRIQTCQVSIKSSADLKGMVSYKDLRDLLKSTRVKN